MSQSRFYIDPPLRYPSIVGRDVAELEKYAELESRKRFIDGLIKTLNEATKSTEPYIVFIVAEWGEGKTSVYEGYLKREDIIGKNIVVGVTGSTIFNWFRRIVSEKEYFTDTERDELKFFAALLRALRDEVEEPIAGINRLPKPEDRPDLSKNTLKFINECLNHIFNNIPKESAIFIFIDEFEDILNQPSEIRIRITSALTEIINGKVREISDKGRYGGRFHFIVSVTPAAYQLIRRELGPVSGRLGGRIERMELHRLNRRESYKLVVGALRYSYDGKILHLPFASDGIINTIYIASLGNPRAIIRIVRTLLSKAMDRETGKLMIIDHNSFIDHLKDEEIEIYGGTLRLLDSRYLDRIYRNISSDTLRNFIHTLIANTAPLKIDEQMYDYISIIEDEYETFGLPSSSFIFLRKVLCEYNKFEDILEDILKNILKLEKEKLIEIKYKLMDVLTFYKYQIAGTLKEEIFVPSEKLSDLKFDEPKKYRSTIEYLRMHIPELNEDDISKIMNLLYDELRKHNSLSNDIYIIPSYELLMNIYPSPLIEYFNFITNSDERFKIWMDTRREFKEDRFFQGIVDLINSSDDISISIIPKKVDAGVIQVCELSYKLITGEVEKFYAYPLFSLNPSKFIENMYEGNYDRIINDVIDKARVPRILIFSYEYPEDFINHLNIQVGHEPGLLNYVCFPLTTLHVQQIIAYQLAKNMGINVNEEEWRKTARRILDEIGFKKMMEKWIEDNRKNGYVVSELPASYRAIVYLANYPKEEATVQDIFNYTSDLSEKFAVYSRRYRFGADPLDIETPTNLKDKLEEIREKGLVKRVGDRYKLENTPVENRLKEIIGRFKVVEKLSDIQSFFIPYNANLEPYIEIMRDKGIITYETEKKGKIKLLSIDDIKRNLKIYSDHLNRIKYGEDIIKIGYIGSVKKRGYNVVIISECIKVMEEILNELRFPQINYEVLRRRFILFEKCLTHVDKIINELLTRQSSEISSKLFDIRTKYKNLIKALNECVEDLAKIGFPTNIDIDEKRSLENIFNNIEEIYNKELSREECKKIVNSLSEEIKYDEPFNIKFLIIKEEFNKFEKQYNNISNSIEKIRDKINNIMNLSNKIRDHDIYNMIVETDLSKKLYQKILHYINTNLNMYIGPSDDISKQESSNVILVKINNIDEELSRRLDKIKNIEDKLKTVYNIFKDIKNKDEEFNNLLKRFESYVKILQQFLNANLNEFNNKFSYIKSEYSKLIEIIDGVNIESENQIIELDKKFNFNLKYLIDCISNNIKEIRNLFDNIKCELSNAKDMLDMLRNIIEGYLKNVHLPEEDIRSFKSILETIDSRVKDIRGFIPDSFDEFMNRWGYKLDGVYDGYRRVKDTLSRLAHDAREFIISHGILNEDELRVYSAMRELKEGSLKSVVEQLSGELGIEIKSLLDTLYNLSMKGFIDIKIRAL